MDYKEIIKKIEPEMEKAVNFFDEESKKIRTGKVSPALIEDLKVDYMGSKFSLKQLASITIGGPRDLLVQPWDKGSALSIEQAFNDNEFGLRAQIDKEIIRVISPELTDDNRQNLKKIMNQKAEDARRIVRHIREEAWTEIQKKTRDGEIREDDKFRAKDDLQEVIDKYNKKIEDILAKKEQELTI